MTLQFPKFQYPEQPQCKYQKTPNKVYMIHCCSLFTNQFEKENKLTG